MSVLRPDYDSDPGRWGSWGAPTDVHETVAKDLVGPVLDAGCGEGRLAGDLADGVIWVGVDDSTIQLAANPYRPVVRAEMAALPFRDACFAEVTHLWCLYHLDQPTSAITEAWRVLRPGGRYFASTSARSSDPELVPHGYPASTFDAEEAPEIVGSVFGHVEAEPWDGHFYPLPSRDEVRAYCRHHHIDSQHAENVEVPLWLTKRGVLVKATRA